MKTPAPLRRDTTLFTFTRWRENLTVDTEQIAARLQLHLAQPVGLGTAFGYWIVASLTTAALRLAQVAEWLFIMGPVLALLGVLSVALVTTPPPPLSESSILVESLVWLVRTSWATMVLAGGAMFSAIVALDLANPKTDDGAFSRTLHDTTHSFVWPIIGVAAAIALGSIPIKLWRVGGEARSASATRLVRWARIEGRAGESMRLILADLASMPASLIVCVFGPVAIYSIASIASPAGLR